MRYAVALAALLLALTACSSDSDEPGRATDPAPQEPAADDALMLDDAGFIAETNATHVFHVAAGVVRTSTTKACPEGITREAVLELCADAGIPTEVGDFSTTQLYTADEAFVTGTMGGLTPVVSVDGRVVGSGAGGPITAKLISAYAELTASSGTVVA